nr:FAD binding domain-containing protein [Nocardioides sp. B-3]
MIASLDGEREVALADYFTGYRTTALQPGELIRSVLIARPLAGPDGLPQDCEAAVRRHLQRRRRVRARHR